MKQRTKDKVVEQLWLLGACEQAMNWVDEHSEASTFAKLWGLCHQPMWMAWLAVCVDYKVAELEALFGKLDHVELDVDAPNPKTEQRRSLACHMSENTYKAALHRTVEYNAGASWAEQEIRKVVDVEGLERAFWEAA